MKKYFNLILFFLIPLFGTTQTLEESLAPICKKMENAVSLYDMKLVATSFDLVLLRFPEELMSNYYAAYAKALLSYEESEGAQRDLILDRADENFNKVQALDPENSETFVLAALLANARLSVDGGSRWKVYGALFDKNIEKAMALNPKNPRIYYLKGTSIFGMPKMFGGGPKTSKEHFVKAKELFLLETNLSIMLPYWGQQMNENYLLKCN